MASGRATLRRALGARWIVGVAAALAFALTLPSIGNGFGIDDHLYRARIVDDGWTASRSARDLFVFTDPDRPEERTAAMASGELSWWAAPQLRWGFLRPIPALIHHAEWTLAGRGGAPWMHLHSVLWMAALAALVALLYRAIMGPTWVAGLAAVLYAVDDGHGFAVGWLANRCAIIGSCFAVLALLAHDRWRRAGWRPGAAAGPLALGAALACSEQMVAACGYLVAYALVLDGAPWRRRAAALAPYAVLVVVWFAVRAGLGYGSDGTGSYTDPFRHPLAFAAQTVERVPILVHSLLGALPADLWEVFFVRRGLGWLMVTLGVTFLAVLARYLVPLLRADRVARFWAIGGGLALPVVCGAHPNDRHLLLVSVAGSALVARLLASVVRSPDVPAVGYRRGVRGLAVALFVIHAVLAPILLPVRARIPGNVSRGVERIDALVPGDPALARQDLVLVSVPFKYLCNFASVVRRAQGGVSPRRWRCLGVTPDDVVVSRPDERTLVLRPTHGYLQQFEDTNVRARSVPFAAGDRVELPELAIAVRAVTPDGRPLELEVRFAVPLEDPSLRWLVWRDRAYRPFAPPAVGQTLTIPAEQFAFGDLLADR